MTFWVARYKSLFLTAADCQQLNGHALVEMLTTPITTRNLTDKRRLPMWSPVKLFPLRRAKVNVKSISCLVLDYDDGTLVEDALERWSPWYCILHTSWSHTEDHHRFRVILPLQRDVTPEEYPALWRWAEMHSGREVDKKCKDSSRAYAVPAVDADDAEHVARFRAEVTAGDLLSPDQVIPLAPKLPPKKVFPTVKLRDLTSTHHLEQVHLSAEDRAAVGHTLHGVVTEESVRLVECPRCRRESVWWWVEPGQFALATCNHKRSCGWSGPVAALLFHNKGSDAPDLDEALQG